MGKKTGIITIVVYLSLISHTLFAIDDVERFTVLKNMNEQDWKKVERGQVAWPEILFPLSSWTDEELKKMPPEFWTRIRKIEREWPLYIEKVGEFHEREFGTGIKNGYDLLLFEQAQMRNPRYFEVSAPVKAKKTLKRLTDIIYLPAKDFNESAQIENVRIYVYNYGKLRPIPFDILECDKEGQVVLPSGPEANPNDGDGIFSKNDLLFFMASDAGHKVDKAYIKNELSGVKESYEIELSYAKEYEKGWVYVVTFSEKAPARSPIDYIKFYPEVGIAFSPYTYAQCECRKEGSKIISTGNVVTMLSSPSMGGIPVDVQNKININLVSIPAVGKKVEFTEKEFDLRDRAWFDGNVINYRRTTWKLKYPFGVGSSTTLCDAILTPFFASNCSTWYASPIPEWAVKYIEMSFGEDMNKRILLNKEIFKTTAKFISSVDREGVFVDGFMSEKEKNWDKSLKSWYILAGFPGTILMRSGCDNTFAKNATLGMDWQDDPEHLGFIKSFIILHGKARTGYFYMSWDIVPNFWAPTRFRWENLDIALKRTDKPLTFHVDEGKEITLSTCIHVADIMKTKKKYRYN